MIYPVDSAIQRLNNWSQEFCYHGNVRNVFSLLRLFEPVSSLAVFQSSLLSPVTFDIIFCLTRSCNFAILWDDFHFTLVLHLGQNLWCYHSNETSEGKKFCKFFSNPLSWTDYFIRVRRLNRLDTFSSMPGYSNVSTQRLQPVSGFENVPLTLAACFKASSYAWLSSKTATWVNFKS